MSGCGCADSGAVEVFWGDDRLEEAVELAGLSLREARKAFVRGEALLVLGRCAAGPHPASAEGRPGHPPTARVCSAVLGFRQPCLAETGGLFFVPTTVV